MLTSNYTAGFSRVKGGVTERFDTMGDIGADSLRPTSALSKTSMGLNQDTTPSFTESRPSGSGHPRTESSQQETSSSSLEGLQGGEGNGGKPFQHPTSQGLSHLFYKTTPRGGEAGGYQNAAALHAAVSTPSDAYTAFEQELLEEINCLRSDPASYAALVENEATLGYPFICMEDEYYLTDAAASNAHEYHPDALLEAVTHVTRTTCPRGREDILFLSTRNTPEPAGSHPPNDHASGSIKHPKTRMGSSTQQAPSLANGSSRPGSEPLSTRSSSKSRGRSTRLSSTTQHRLNKSSTSSIGQTAHPNPHSNTQSATRSPKLLNLQFAHNAAAVPSTLKKQGLTEMTLEQLGTHLRRHELHRFALEKAAEDILIRWQLAQLALQEMTSAEDDRVGKKPTKGQHATMKESVLGTASAPRTSAFPQGCAHRKSHERAANVEGVSQQRFEIAERLRFVFASHLRTILEKLCVEHLICKRSMDGANLILECVQALRQVSPVPKLLPRRGLHLAARNVSLFHHTLGECVSKAPSSSSSNLLSSPFSTHLPHGGETPLAPLLVNPQDYFPIALQDGGDAKPAHTLKEWVKSRKHHATGVFNAHTQLLAHQLTPAALTKDLSGMARLTSDACGRYGQLTNQLHGLQLYGPGKPREVILRALLGVLIPQFVVYGGGRVAEAARRDASKSVGRLLTAQEVARLFQLSVFKTAACPEGERASEKEREGEGGLYGVENEPASVTEHTGLMLCGVYHPTTVSALIRRLLEQDSEPTSYGKRVVTAGHRLGPLLWRDARVVGIGWQLACRPLTYDEPEKSVLNIGGGGGSGAGAGDGLDERDRTPSGDYVCTTIILATGYEELELIAMNQHASLDEVNRIVHQCQEVNTLQSELFSLPLLTGCSTSTEVIGTTKDLSQITTCSSVADLPVMVDLHSDLGVKVVYPRCHPLVLEVDPITSRRSGVAVVVLRVDRARARVQACLSAFSAHNSLSMVPFSPPEMQASPEILLQRSVADRDVVLIMIDIMSVIDELLQDPLADAGTAFSSPHNMVRFLHIFESAVNVGNESSDGSTAAVSGYTFIGFIRLVIQMKGSLSCRDGAMNCSQKKLSLSQDTRLCGTAYAAVRGVAAQMALGTRLVEVSSASTRKARSQPSKRLLKASGASAAWGGIFLPSLYENFLSHLDFSARMIPLEVFHDGLSAFNSARDASSAVAAGVCGGWPDVSADFTDRGGCILSPLISTLPSDSNSIPVRFAVYLPADYQTSGIALQQKKALLVLLQSLEETEAAEELKERTDIALMEEAQKRTETAPGSDSEFDGKAENLSRPGSSHEEGNTHTTIETEIQSEEAASTSAWVSVDVAEAHVLSASATSERAPRKARSTRTKKGSKKNMADNTSGNLGSNRRSKKLKSPERNHTHSPKLKSDQRSSKLHLRRNGSIGGFKQGAPREPINSNASKLQESLLNLFEDGNLDLIRLFDAPSSHLEGAVGKQSSGAPQVLSHDALMSMSLVRLRNLVDEQARLLGERRTLLVQIETIFDDELQRLETEISKRKGRELIKLKRDEEDISHQLEQMHVIVQNYEKHVQHSKEVLTRRTRDRTLRRARLEQVRAHLAMLCGANYANEGHAGFLKDSHCAAEPGGPFSSLPAPPCDVTIWFVPKGSVPNILRVAPWGSSSSQRALREPGFTTAQRSVSLSANNFVPLVPVALPGHPLSYCYEATVQVPSALRGCAVLLVNGYECALWEV